MSATHQQRFWILVSLVAISGFSQGMLLPLIAIIFEKDGLSYYKRIKRNWIVPRHLIYFSFYGRAASQIRI